MDFLDFRFFCFLYLFLPFGSLGGIPLHSQRNFDPDDGPETPRWLFLDPFQPSFCIVLDLGCSKWQLFLKKSTPAPPFFLIPRVENDRILIL